MSEGCRLCYNKIVASTTPGRNKPKTNLRHIRGGGECHRVGRHSSPLPNPSEPLLVVAEAVCQLFVLDSSRYLYCLLAGENVEIIARRKALKNQIFPEAAESVEARFLRLEFQQA